MSKFMDIETAFQIVYELAKENVITEREVQQEIELKDEYDHQNSVLDTFHDFVVNNETKYITKKR